LNQKHYSSLDVKYRVREPLLAVIYEPGIKTAFMTIEPGSIIVVKSGEDQSGFADVSYNDQIVKVFVRDIEKRADRVEGQTG
jgi:hypothetical protein